MITHAFKATNGGEFEFVHSDGRRTDGTRHIAYQNKTTDRLRAVIKIATKKGEAMPGNTLVLDVTEAETVIKRMYEQLFQAGPRALHLLRHGAEHGWKWQTDPDVPQGYVVITYNMPAACQERAWLYYPGC